MCIAYGQLLEWLLEQRLCIPRDASQSPWSFVVIAPAVFSVLFFFFFGDSIYFILMLKKMGIPKSSQKSWIIFFFLLDHLKVDYQPEIPSPW